MLSAKLCCYSAYDNSRHSHWMGVGGRGLPGWGWRKITNVLFSLCLFPPYFLLLILWPLFTLLQIFLPSGSFVNGVTFLPASSGWLERRQTGIRVAAGAEPCSVPAAVPVDWEETASSCSMLFPLLAQGKPSCRHARGPAVLPLLARSPARQFGQGSCATELWRARL